MSGKLPYRQRTEVHPNIQRHLPDRRALHLEYLSLVGIVRNSVDVEKKRRAEGVRERIEGILHSGEGVEDGSARVLRAALNKANKQRAAIIAEERRVSRARKKMRQIEEKVLYFQADEQTQELHKERVSISHNRMQAYYALRSQLKVERALGTLKREVDEIADLLGSLVEKCDQTNDCGQLDNHVGSDTTSDMGDADDMSLVSFDASLDEQVNEEHLSEDNEIQHESGNVGGEDDDLESRYRDADEDEIGEEMLYEKQEKQHKLQKNRSLGRSFRVIRPRVNGFGMTDQSQSRLMRLMIASRPNPSRSGDVQRTATGTATMSTEEMLEKRGGGGMGAMFGAVRNTMRFRVATLKAAGKLKRGWMIVDERYSMILSLAPHFMEERLVPLASIEGGLLGEWPQRKRGERWSAQDRLEFMLSKVEEALRVVSGMERWQRELVGTIRTDYRKHREKLRKTETDLSELYVKQMMELNSVGASSG